MLSYCFDPLADAYDRSRTLDPLALDGALDYISERFPASSFPRAIEIGVGTGRIAVPIAMRGYRVIGLDISRRMLARLTARRSTEPAPRIDALLADATHAPLRSGVCDVAYWVHVLHLISGWRNAIDELLRVVRPGGVLLMLDAGRGREIPALFNEYRRLAKEAGHQRPRLGPRSRQTVLRFLASRGCEVHRIRSRWRWVSEIPLSEALADIDAAIYATVRFTPEAVHRRIASQLRKWASERFGGPDASVRVPNAISIAVARRPARLVPQPSAVELSSG